MPKRNPNDHISRCLNTIHNEATIHQNFVCQLISQVDLALQNQADHELELGNILKQYPLTQVDRNEIELRLLNNKKNSVDFPITRKEYAIGLGRTDRFLAYYIADRNNVDKNITDPKNEPFPDPLNADGNTYSLREVHTWFRGLKPDDSRKKSFFDPVRVPKLWVPLPPRVKRPHMTTARKPAAELE